MSCVSDDIVYRHGCTVAKAKAKKCAAPSLSVHLFLTVMHA